MERNADNPTSFLDLLKISLRLTDQETREWDSESATPMEEERRKWLASAMDAVSQNDDTSRLRRCIQVLKEVPVGEVEKEDTVQAVANAMEEIEFLVERLDNAKDLHLLGGLKLVVQYLCCPRSELRWKAAEVIAVAVQNNPFSQVAATQLGAIPILLLLISSDEVEAVRVKAVYALSGLIRNCEMPESTFLQHRGYEALHVAMKSGVVKLQMKAAFLTRGLISQDSTSQGNKILNLFIEDGLIDTLIRFLKTPHDDSNEFMTGLLCEVIQRCDNSTVAAIVADRELCTTLAERRKELESADPDYHQEEIESLSSIIQKLSAHSTS